jgi:2-phosphosulfolactate phosphatase
VEEARELARRYSPRALLGGERAGVRIKGFDLGNSPTEHTAERVTGRTIVFTTTNGTKAMQRARQAQRVLLGAFTHLSVLAKQLRAADSIQILCAGTQNQITREDVLLAGALVDRLTQPIEPPLNDSARIAWAAWREFTSRAASLENLSKLLATELRDTQGGRNLIRLGLEADLSDAASIDRFDFAPILDVRSWRITKHEGAT